MELRDAARGGERWLTENEAEQGNQEGIKKRLRKSARLLDSYAAAAGKKMGIAVFGPSQVGKSTMISALAKGPSGKLQVDFGGDRLDFIREVNPEGGKETTGLVTRFSLEAPPRSPDPQLPVCVKLFSEMDIVKILANTYYSEAEGGGENEVDDGHLKTVLDKLEKRAGSFGNTPTLDQMEDLNEYVDSIGAKLIYGKSLRAMFWPRAIELAQKLDIKERAELISFIWGGVPEFTAVYAKLVRALSSLGFPATAFTGINALYDRGMVDQNKKADGRANSILQASMLKGVLDEQTDKVDVISQDGARASLERPVLSALIAELHVKVMEKPGDFMDKADILDFPGYRARKKYGNFNDEIKNPDNLAECILRGKVAYVFQRYAAQKEITAMLLCVWDRNVDCPGLPEVVNGWIGDAHGPTPAARTGKPVCLFLVLTFFNNHLIPTEGAADLSTVFQNRFHASIRDTFAKDKWPDQWSQEGGQNHPFRNCYWLLNVRKTEAYLDIENVSGGSGDSEDEAWRSRGVRPEQRPWIDKLKAGYLASENVNKYVQDPEAAWDGALESEDGGTGYIIAHLTPLVGQDLKTPQLTALTLTEGENVHATLASFYKGGSSDEEKQVKRQAYFKVSGVLSRLGNPADGQQQGKAPAANTPWHRFGLLLRDMTLSDDECHEIFSRPVSEPEEDGEDGLGAEPQDAPESEDDEMDMGEINEEDILGTFFSAAGAGPAGPVPSAAPAPARREDDTASMYRRMLEREWKESLERLTSDKDKRRFYGFPPDMFRAFISEVDHGARRMGVMEGIELALREAMGYANVNPASRRWTASRIASAHLSDYVSFLGLSPRVYTRQERTLTFQGKVFVVFEPPVQNEGFPELPELSPPYESPYHRDWRLSLYKVMMDNVDFADKNYNQEANSNLGRILKIIQGQRTTLKPTRAA
jgi:hypothetical protein